MLSVMEDIMIDLSVFLWWFWLYYESLVAWILATQPKNVFGYVNVMSNLKPMMIW